LLNIKLNIYMWCEASSETELSVAQGVAGKMRSQTLTKVYIGSEVKGWVFSVQGSREALN
jgi:hypothetical protein